MPIYINLIPFSTVTYFSFLIDKYLVGQNDNYFDFMINSHIPFNQINTYITYIFIAMLIAFGCEIIIKTITTGTGKYLD